MMLQIFAGSATTILKTATSDPGDRKSPIRGYEAPTIGGMISHSSGHQVRFVTPKKTDGEYVQSLIEISSQES